MNGRKDAGALPSHDAGAAHSEDRELVSGRVWMAALSSLLVFPFFGTR